MNLIAAIMNGMLFFKKTYENEQNRKKNQRITSYVNMNGLIDEVPIRNRLVYSI